MAGEFKHRSWGPILNQEEFEAPDGHEVVGGSPGDLIVVRAEPLGDDFTNELRALPATQGMLVVDEDGNEPQYVTTLPSSITVPHSQVTGIVSAQDEEDYNSLGTYANNDQWEELAAVTITTTHANQTFFVSTHYIVQTSSSSDRSIDTRIALTNDGATTNQNVEFEPKFLLSTSSVPIAFPNWSGLVTVPVEGSATFTLYSRINDRSGTFIFWAKISAFSVN